MKRKANRPQKPKPSNPGRVTLQKLTFHKLDWLEKITIVLSLWFLIFPYPYKILLSVLLLIPLLGLVLNGLGKPSIASLVEISKNEKGEDTYDVADFIDFPAIIIMVRVARDFEFDNISSMILPGSIACLSVLVVLFITHKRIVSSLKNRLWIYSSVILTVSLYSFAGTYAANCAYDNSTPDIYYTAVLDKSIYRSKRHTSYYVKVAPWGHHYDEEKISVSRSQYDELQISDKIVIDLKKGVFNIPWYFIERKREPNE